MWGGEEEEVEARPKSPVKTRHSDAAPPLEHGGATSYAAHAAASEANGGIAGTHAPPAATRHRRAEGSERVASYEARRESRWRGRRGERDTAAAAAPTSSTTLHSQIDAATRWGAGNNDRVGLEAQELLDIHYKDSSSGGTLH
jgi:hypothetical protein